MLYNMAIGSEFVVSEHAAREIRYRGKDVCYDIPLFTVCRHFELLKRTVRYNKITHGRAAIHTTERFPASSRNARRRVPVSSYLIKCDRSAYFQRFESERPSSRRLLTVSHFRRGN